MTQSIPISLALFGSLFCLALAPPAIAKSRDDDRAVASLVRGDDAADPNARGSIEIRDKRDDQRLRVKLRNVSPQAVFDLFMEDGGGELEFLAQLRERGGFQYRARLRDDRGELPFGAVSVRELMGRRVEIRLDDELLLFGQVPDFASRRRVRAQTELAPTDFAPRRADARLKILSRPSKGDERFSVRVEDFPLSSGAAIRLFMEDPEVEDSLVDLGPFRDDRDEDDEFKFRRRTRKGDPLPFGVASVLDLGGLAVEIRDADTGEVYFEGEVPLVE
jgi:hypothetical protein